MFSGFACGWIIPRGNAFAFVMLGFAPLIAPRSGRSCLTWWVDFPAGLAASVV
jgi:hypothetical protein